MKEIVERLKEAFKPEKRNNLFFTGDYDVVAVSENDVKAIIEFFEVYFNSVE